DRVDETRTHGEADGSPLGKNPDLSGVSGRLGSLWGRSPTGRSRVTSPDVPCLTVEGSPGGHQRSRSDHSLCARARSFDSLLTLHAAEADLWRRRVERRTRCPRM